MADVVGTLLEDISRLESTEGCLPRLLPQIGRLLGTDMSCAYRLHIAPGEHRLDFLHLCGVAAPEAERIRRFADRTQARWTLYNPARPEPRQRNVVRRPREEEPPSFLQSPIYRDLYRQIGMASYGEIRVLICDGASLLSWVGAWRVRPFTDAEARQLASIVPALRSRLIVERHLRDAQLATAGLEAALGALTSPAFIVSVDRRIVHMNAPARGLYERDPRGLNETLREAMAGRRDTDAHIVRLADIRGLPDHFLIVLRGARPLAIASTQFGLTRRQAEVLELVVRGHANRTIAELLGCTLRTVEQHVTALLSKAGVESRTALVALILGGH